MNPISAIIELDSIKAVREITQLTQSNNHTEARLKACELIKETELQKQYKAVETLQNFFGYLPHGLGQTRDELDRRLRLSLANYLGDWLAAKVWAAL